MTRLTFTLPLAFGAALLVVVGCARLLPDPTSTEPRAPVNPVTANATRDGIVVDLVLDRDRLAPNDTMTVMMRVVNTGPTPAFWQGSECQIVSGMRIDGPPLDAP
ncbi:MAG TPA: hypothetical protein VM344_10290, partial [Vitreimonas sp.]|nr:hypothetical protein [Vitreimonas sp.]